MADAENIESNFRDYLNGFSDNVQDILSNFDFESVIKRMVDNNILYLVIKEFASPKGYLGADKISAVDCGYILPQRRAGVEAERRAGSGRTERGGAAVFVDIATTKNCHY